ncbi:N-acetylglucosamine kinase [Aquipuribacter sp. MA13-6]|uniref:N-acetylglucosamine kinase n=1 Tax=unclassified Aquipuribacter TaxID=2635084 RepID=UPI003EED6554
MTRPPGAETEDRRLLLAVDAGGSSTRAVLVEPDGRCLGYGLGPAGNPTSAGPQGALAAIAGAAGAALAQAGRPASVVTDVLVALAGARGLLPTDVLAGSLGFVGPPERLRTVSDILAMYHSGAREPSGGAVVAGTGSVAARVVGGEVVRVHGGSGWLLGDAGSGFDVGHRVVRAVVGELDGIAPATVLTPLLLAELGIDRDDSLRRGRVVALDRLMGLLYQRRPAELAQYAPLAFAAAGDPVAEAVVERAQDDVAVLVRVARAGAGPLVLGGGVMLHGLLAAGRPRSAALAEAMSGADARYARDGAVGAAVAGLSRPGWPLDATVFQRLRSGVADQEQVRVAVGPGPDA